MFLRSYRKQNLLIEFASLKYVQPQGLYLSLTPGDPTLWNGILFVRKGPYAPAIFRFKISFPGSYPLNPPLITFMTDLFHPLLAPLTTASFVSSISDHDSDGSIGEARLPAGAFSLRHGFPQWRRRRNSQTAYSTVSPKKDQSQALDSFSSPNESPELKSGFDSGVDEPVHIIDVLRYMRSCFEDEKVLDSLPFEASGNAGAWYAWRAHRAKHGIKFENSPSESPRKRDPKEKSGPRHPSEWNWEGVWIDRARKAIQTSLSEPALYGSGGAGRDDEIHFRTWNNEAEEIEDVQAEMRSHLRLHD